MTTKTSSMCTVHASPNLIQLAKTHINFVLLFVLLLSDIFAPSFNFGTRGFCSQRTFFRSALDFIPMFWIFLLFQVLLEIFKKTWPLSNLRMYVLCPFW